jgi:hypothetical protein
VKRIQKNMACGDLDYNKGSRNVSNNDNNNKNTSRSTNDSFR